MKMDWGTLDFERLANGLLILIVGILSVFGIRGGQKKAAEQQPATAEIAGALVDSSAVNRLTGAIEKQTVEMSATRAEAKDNTHVLARRIEGLSDQVDDLGSEVRALREEMIRKR